MRATGAVPRCSLDRLAADFAALRTFSAPGPGVTRRAFGPEHAAARAWCSDRMRDAGLKVRVDAAGNLIGRQPRRGAALATGSHLDSVRQGGNFDGPVGVLGALEAVRTLGDRLRHPVEVVDFLAEEPTDFGVSCVGSCGLAGHLTQAQLDLMMPGGECLAEAIDRVGGASARLGPPLWSSEQVAAFVELHVEQGPVLEADGLQVAAVTLIVGIDRWSVTIDGRPDHAGTMPMEQRCDALCAASEVVLLMESVARALGGGTVATTGRLQVEPNAPNVVPGRVHVIVEARSPAPERLEQVSRHLAQECQRIGQGRGVVIALDLLSHQAPQALDPRVVDAVVEAMQRLGHAERRLPSFAGHDAAHVGDVVAAGMLFVPSRAGRSHVPEEHTDLRDITAGVDVLIETLLLLDERLP